MIKSKIDARERALELVASLGLHDRELIMDMAKEFTDFLIGDAELPETQSDTELVKAFLEVMNSEFEKKCKPNTPDYEELLKAIQTSNAGISADTPCKSEAE
jgi:hypothetical protein